MVTFEYGEKYSVGFEIKKHYLHITTNYKSIL